MMKDQLDGKIMKVFIPLTAKIQFWISLADVGKCFDEVAEKRRNEEDKECCGIKKYVTVETLTIKDKNKRLKESNIA